MLQCCCYFPLQFLCGSPPQFHLNWAAIHHQSSVSHLLSSSVKIWFSTSSRLTFPWLAIVFSLSCKWIQCIRSDKSSLPLSEESFVENLAQFRCVYWDTNCRVCGTSPLFCRQGKHIGKEWRTRSVIQNVLSSLFPVGILKILELEPDVIRRHRSKWEKPHQWCHETNTSRAEKGSSKFSTALWNIFAILRPWFWGVVVGQTRL